MTPVVRGLHLAERVDVDLVTKNLTLVNCFRELRVPSLPGTARPFYLVAYLVNGLGDVRLTAVVSRLDTLGEVFRASVVFRFPDRLQEVRFKLRVEQCPFRDTGGYQVELWADDQLLTQTPFTILSPKV